MNHINQKGKSIALKEVLSELVEIDMLMSENSEKTKWYGEAKKKL